jgi:hypothetical protein
MSIQSEGHRADSAAAEPKAVVRRLIEEVINGGRLDLIDELYAPDMAAGARRWIAPFRESFPDVQRRSSS